MTNWIRENTDLFCTPYYYDYNFDLHMTIYVNLIVCQIQVVRFNEISEGEI